MKNTNLTNRKNSRSSAILKYSLSIFILIAGLIFVSPTNANAQAGKAIVNLARIIIAGKTVKDAVDTVKKPKNSGRNPGTVSRTSNYSRQTIVNFCNYTGEPELYVAVGHQASQNDWISRGWFGVRNGSCRQVDIGRNYSGYIYTYAINQDSTLEWRGSHSFYVDWQEGFSLNQSRYGLDRNGNYKPVGMREFKVVPGVNNYRYR